MHVMLLSNFGDIEKPLQSNSFSSGSSSPPVSCRVVAILPLTFGLITLFIHVPQWKSFSSRSIVLKISNLKGLIVGLAGP